MCGIVGYVDLRTSGIADPALGRAMADRIVHRGPDAEGVWAEGPVALAHRRLSILELSPSGAQPMRSASGRYVIVYNGEIYNYRDLRATLEAAGAAPAWRGGSDTEVILAAVDAWGLETALTQLTGMFAFALWDCHEQALFLARDRAGEKPLYYSVGPTAFLFASELKALKAHPAFSPDIDRAAVGQFLRYAYVPAPATIYRNVSKLLPGQFLRLARDGGMVVRSYWALADVIDQAKAAAVDMSPDAATDRLEALLREVVGSQMVADVPLGAFLSGGIDSSTVVALMQAQSSMPVKTFSIGFSEAGYDEAQYARQVAAHLGTDHSELYVSSQDAQQCIPDLPTLYDEPFADASQIPTFLVCKLARQTVTVALSGDGGDEIFGGYSRYNLAETFDRHIRPIPAFLRKGAAAAIQAIPPGAMNALGRCGVPTRFGALLGDKLHKVARSLPAADLEELYQSLVSMGANAAGLMRADSPLLSPSLVGGQALPAGLSPIEKMMALDYLTYLADDILVKVDRAAMATSLETRVPFLDHRIVALAWSLPQSVKIRDGKGKWILRQVLRRHIPESLIERPKMGFAVPVGQWVKGPLRDWAEDLLSPARIDAGGLLEPAAVTRLWEQHRLGVRDHTQQLWAVLMLQAWQAHWAA